MINKIVLLVERFGALVLAIIATLTFVSVLMRYIISEPIPDSFDFSRLLMGMVILWGMASACYYGEHIRFDAVWSIVGQRWKHIIDVVANLVTLGAISVLTFVLAVRVEDSRASFVTTSGLGIELWPFHLVAWVGSALAVLLSIVRVMHLLFSPNTTPSSYSEDGF